MLVISRKDSQRVRIGKDVYVTVVQTRKGKVRLGIEAPPHEEIVRCEIDREPGPDEDTVIHKEDGE